MKKGKWFPLMHLHTTYNRSRLIGNTVNKAKVVPNSSRLKRFIIVYPRIFITHCIELNELLFIFNGDKPSLHKKRGPVKSSLKYYVSFN